MVSIEQRSDERSDEDLLAATGRDAEAFGAFYRRHERMMLIFFLRRTSSAEVAADLTAEVFAAALGAAHRFRPGAKPAVAWLYGIANNKLASSYSGGWGSACRWCCCCCHSRFPGEWRVGRGYLHHRKQTGACGWQKRAGRLYLPPVDVQRPRFCLWMR